MRYRLFALGWSVLLGLCLVGAVVWIAPARANAPFAVDSTVDEIDAAPGDGNCISTPSGQCTLRAAIMEANALAGDDTINLPAGIYTLTLAGVNEDAGLTGDLDITSTVTIEGAGAESTVIDANALDRRRKYHWL
jgi:CSLREA domain-containing protein